jgi:hypothetical protein
VKELMKKLRGVIQKENVACQMERKNERNSTGGTEVHTSKGGMYSVERTHVYTWEGVYYWVFLLEVPCCSRKSNKQYKAGTQLIGGAKQRGDHTVERGEQRKKEVMRLQ